MPGDDKHDELSEIESILGASVTATDATPAAPAASDATPSPSGAESGGSAAAPGAEGGAPSAAAPGAETGAVPAAQTGAAQQEETIRLPNIEVHDFENVDLCDAISPWLSYNGTISQGGAPPSGFGVTRPGPMTVADITVRKVPLIGWWYVSATINQQIQWQVRAATGPTGQVNIGSALDPAITTANWPTVVSDLTPDMSDLQGRPPRNAFWAKDITETHEQFHANDRKTQAPAALALASAWLGTQQAATAADVAPLLATVPGRMVATVTAGMTYPGKEERAYSDGAGAYSRRALAISALGTVGYY
jgi:hypothetical protein